MMEQAWPCAGVRREKGGEEVGRSKKEMARRYKKEKARRVERQTYFSRLAICFTASTAPGRGSRSIKKFSDSHMLMAFS